MSDPVLDLIDGAIWAYGDAMRWTPEPAEDAAETPTGPTRADIARLFDIPPELLDGPDFLFRRLPEVDTYGRVPYMRLTEQEREALHQWCVDHRIDYKQVPIDGLIELDPAMGEWRVEVYRARDGKHFLDVDGDIARAILRRAHKADLPWRRP
jgi:hypothetical protein